MTAVSEVRMTLRVPDEVRERIATASRREGNPQSTVIRRALLIGLAEIEQYLDQRRAGLTKGVGC
jgi:predicted DNA-binding protein